MWGIDRLSGGQLSAVRKRLRNGTCAVLTHHAAVDRRGRSTLEVLDELGVVPWVVFTPEHGFDGSAQAEQSVPSQIVRPPRSVPPPAAAGQHSAPEPDGNAEHGAQEHRAEEHGAQEHSDAEHSAEEHGAQEHSAEPASATEDACDDSPSDASQANTDERADAHGVESSRGVDTTGPNLISLYSEDKSSLTPADEHLHGISNLVIDLVDVGSRYYTYVWTALLAARKAISLGVHVIILDRPNPLGGDPSQCEGKPQAPEFLSFVGLEPIAIRHGLTLGEILTLFLCRDGHTPGPDAAFSVVACKGWERHRTAEAWNRPFVPPSPNMPSLETALLYPGGCLVEGTNLSEGRGTALPFRVIGAPFLDGPRLAKDLLAAHLPGVMVRPTSFRPSFEKHSGQLCHGVMLHVTNAAQLRPVTTYLTLITLAYKQNPELFAFRTQAYEFEHERLAFDLLTGSSAAREAILAGASANEVVELVAPVGPDVTQLAMSLESDYAKACGHQ